MMRQLRAPFILVMIALFALSGCGKGIITNKVENRIEAALPQYIGPAESYTAKVDAGLGQMMDGRLRALHIEGIKVQLTKDLVVDRLYVDMEQVAFDTKKNSLKSVGSTRLRAEIGENTIERYLIKAHPEVEGIRVSIRQEGLRLAARPGILGLKLPVEAEGKLELADATKLNFVPSRVSAGGIGAPAAVANLFTKFINPVLDISKFSYPAKLTSVGFEPGKLIITGTAELRTKEKTP